jgi:hypothetical protein
MFTEKYMIELGNLREGGKIYYTTDGSEPTENSSRYTVPFNISETTTLKAFTKWNDASSRTISYYLEKKRLMTAIGANKVKPGLKAIIYNGEFNVLPDFSKLKSVINKTVPVVSHTVAGRDSLFGIVFEGYLLVPADGVYGLYVNSDDGSKMVIDGTDAVVNDGIHGMKEEGRYYPLAKGYHKLRIEYFQRTGGMGLEFLVEAPDQPKKIVPQVWLFN